MIRPTYTIDNYTFHSGDGAGASRVVVNQRAILSSLRCRLSIPEQL